MKFAATPRTITAVSLMWFVLWGVVFLLFLWDFPMTSFGILFTGFLSLELIFSLSRWTRRGAYHWTKQEWAMVLLALILLTTLFFRLSLNESFLSKRLFDPYRAVKAEDVTTLKTLLDGFDVNVRGNNLDTPLHAAAAAGRIESILFLLSKGADVNARNYDGETPLEKAQRHHQKRAVELLREVGTTAPHTAPEAR